VSLDITKVAAQVSGMIARLRDGSAQRQQRLQCALDTLGNQSADFEALQRKIAAARTTWLVAELVEGLDGHYAAPPAPAEFTVMATDGSHIDVDRHRSARCCLINIGAVVLSYGDEPSASLDSIPYLYSGDEEMMITPPGANKGRQQPLEGTLLGIRRSVDECRYLAELAAGLPAESSTLALIDGTLILWGLEAYPDFVGDVLLHGGFLRVLDDMKKLNSERRLALASYISFPRGTDVVNALRVALCPQEPVDCDRCSTRDCDVVAGVRDRDLFSNLLGEGERSDIFISQSSVVRKHYGEHKVYFFYVRVGEEIARVEIPQWVALKDTLLNLTHSLVLDQCRRGYGYPVALSEAHEQAVVTGADREEFWQLVEQSLVEEKLPASGSAKSFSKRTRWV